ncbi:MAG TPA: Tn3 family transposase, partial [Ferruginibacter sp.]|nr:Tn3 family transposase [Ferruginibacter sp.]
MISHLFLYKGWGSLFILSFTSSTDTWSAALVILAIALSFRSWFPLFRILPQTASWYQTINRNLIKENWDDLLRVAGSLKLGTVNVTELLRALQGNGHPSTLAKAIAELGRIAKTLYLLSYIDDPAYRRRILIQLNKGES